MQYRKIALGMGLLVVCIVVGAFIPIGTGSAVLIGFVVGLVLCYGVLYQKRFWTTSPGGGEVNQKAIQEKTLNIQEAALADQARSEFHNRHM
jgi:predicted RND superfamily exporter protein